MMTPPIAVGTRRRYVRARLSNREIGDLQRSVLNYLNIVGPSSVTEIAYTMEINYKQSKDTIARLASHGFVIRKEPRDFLKPGRRSAQGRIGRMSSAVKLLSVITPLGRQYLEKINALELMIKWELKQNAR